MTRIALACLLGCLIATPSLARTALTANTSFYVNSSTGSDTATCGPSTTPCASPNGAMSAIANGYDYNGHTITIQLTAGQTYTAASPALAVLGLWNGVGHGNLIVDGAGTALLSASGAQDALSQLEPINQGVVVQNIHLSSPSQCGVYAQESGVLTVGANVYVQNSLYQLCAGDSGAILVLTGPIYLSGNATVGIMTNNNSEVFNDGASITISGNPSYWAFVYAFANGEYWGGAPNGTFIGTATGNKCTAVLNGVVATNGHAASLPGNVACSTASGGQVN